MPIFTVRHETIYRYRAPVHFGEHRMMLQPRDDPDQSVIAASYQITPPPVDVRWERDRFGNHVAVARFDEAATTLRFLGKARIQQTPVGIGAALFSPRVSHPNERAARSDLSTWVSAFDPGRTLSQRDFAVAVTKAIHRGFRHVARHENGAQTAGETLAVGRGTSRDFAVLMIEALRLRGIRASFVSGYVFLPNDPPERTRGGDTHAWVQASVDGSWMDFDPAYGTIGNSGLIRIAVVDEPDHAPPLHGAWFGQVGDFIGKDVSVKVRVERAEAA